MKIKTITCHNVYNYGASLQAYALMSYLRKLCKDVEIIDYRPEYLSRRYNLWSVKSDIIRKAPKIFHFFYLLAAVPKRIFFTPWKRKTAFDTFRDKFLVCTDRIYHTFDDLKNDPPVADLYIAGSDQIWNTRFDNGKDPSFYLDFVSDKRRCISYAGSLGISYIEAGYENFIKEKLHNFYALSVREKTGADMLKSMGFESVQSVDPVFLLTLEEWMFLVNKKYNEKYVLVYDFNHKSPELKKVAKAIALKHGLKVYSVNDNKRVRYADKNIDVAGPIEFLELIASAECVVCNSFHGTAFSVLFNRPFYSFPILGAYHKKNSSRMADFIKIIGLEKRFVLNSCDVDIDDFEIDFSTVNSKINDLRKDGIDYLKRQIYRVENMD